ncbi:leucine-rich repeat domain-containing protein [Fluviispira vulneris]|uniref:leucine-rich repeat domain-containing protein n=1 Tax=Fluviispira vulneris TaxID=2763012 RepID=UPI001646C58C|nr:leucine-rich repeat protein [Fluviispira vulneris]
MKRNGFILSSSALLAIVYSNSAFAAEYKVEEFKKNVIYLDPNTQTQAEILKTFPITVKDLINNSNNLAAKSIKFKSDESQLTDYFKKEFCRKVKFKIENGHFQIISAPNTISTMMTCYYKASSTDPNVVLTSKQKSLEIKFNYDFDTWRNLIKKDIYGREYYLTSTKFAKYIHSKINSGENINYSKEILLDGSDLWESENNSIIEKERTGDWDQGSLSYNGDTNLDMSAIYQSKMFPNLEKLTIKNFKIVYHDSNPFAFPKSLSLKHLIYSRNKFNEVKKDSFRRIKNLENLDLRGNYIRKIEDNSFEKLESLKQLNLDHNELSEVSSKTFAGLKSLQELNLSNNSGEKSAQFELRGSPKLPKLEKLSITRSHVGKIDKEFFQSMPLLAHLNLEINALTEIPENIFVKNHSLKEVNLSRNRIQNISSLGNTNIVDLNLSTNKIESLDDSFFNSIQNIEVLNLSQNSIHSINKSHLSPELKVVNLGNNKLTSIPNALSNNLEDLTISINKIEQLNGNELAQYFNLKSLNLFDNQIKEIPSEAFKTQSKLIKLTLAKNKFTEVPTTSFQYLASLETLDLSNNSLQSINQNSFDGLNSLKNLFINHNEVPLAFNINHNIRLDSISILYSLRENEVNRVKKLFEGTPKITIHNEYDY